MNKKLVIGASAILLFCGMAAAYFGLTNEPQLIEDQVAEAPRPVRDLEFTKQHKFVKLDQKILEGLVHDVDTIHIQLFSGENVVIHINKRQPINDNDAIAYGKVEGDEGSQVILSMAGNADGGRTEAMAGTIDFSDGRSFKIDYVGDGVHKLVEIDPNAIGLICTQPEGPAGVITGPNGEKIKLMYQRKTWRGGPIVAVSRPTTIRRMNPINRASSTASFTFSMRASARLPRASIKQPWSVWSRNGRSTTRTYTGMTWSSAHTGPNVVFGGASARTSVGTTPTPTPAPSPKITPGTLEILVVYTDGAAQAKGGDAGIKALAGAAVGNVNTALKNSGINIEVKLVGTAKWSGHTSSGNLSSDINALSGDAAIKVLRTQNKADLVAALVPGQASGTTGIGSLPSGTSGNKNACWSVTKVDAVGAPARSFAHEIGHNLGAGHADSAGAESAAKGWRFTGTDGKKYLTLLSYQNEAGETRIPHYSNPSVNFQGTSTGTGTANNSATISNIIIKATGYN